jgi:ribosome-associated protein
MTGLDDLTTPRGIRVTAEALNWTFSRSEGAGGQSVNKTATKASVTVDIADVTCTLAQRARIVAALGDSVTITCQITRSQWRNRQLCLEQLAEALDKAAAPPPPARRKTKPSRGAIERRLESKKRDSAKKRDRRSLE